MKNIEIDEELYQYIASNTQFIGESASAILRRLLSFSSTESLVEKEKPASNTELKSVKTEKPKAEKPQSKESLFNYINKEELAMQRGAVGRFLLILQALYRVHQQEFSVVNTIRGRDRLYFSTNENALEEAGSSTKPRQIPESPYWVITNSNTTRKKMMLTDVATVLGYSDVDAEKIRDLL